MATLENVASAAMNDTTTETTTASIPLYPPAAFIVFACVWTLTSVLGIVGNSLVICSVALSKKLRTITNAFVVNLSVADLWTSLCYPWQVVAILSDGTWPLQTEFPCIIAAVQLYTGLGASLYSLAAIAFNRCILVTRSVDTYRRWYSRRRVIVMIAATWVIPFVVFFLPPILDVGEYGYEPESRTCSDRDNHPQGPVYNLAQSLGLFPVPMIIIVTSYMTLYIYLRSHFSKQKKRSTAVSPAGEGSSTFAVVNESEAATTDAITASSRRAISRQQLAITKNLFLVFCIFFLLLSPYFITLAVPSARRFALYWLSIAILNSCVNPIIYTASHPHFKVVLRKMIRCRFSEIPEPSGWLRSVLLRRRK